MVRSAARAPVLAIFGAVGLAIFQQIRSAAFVSSTWSNSNAGHRSRSRVARLAKTAEIAEAEKHVKLVTWAAKKAAEEGMPQAAMMQAKAEKAVLALEALIEQESGEAPAPTAARPAAVDTIQRATETTPVMVEEIVELEKHVKLLTWAAKTAAAKGMPQAAAAQVRADEAVQRLMQLKEQQEAQQGGRSVTTIPASPAPAPPAPAAPAVAVGTVSKEEVAEADKRAKLAVWAAKKTAEEGMPQAPMMQAKADEAVRALEALKEALAQQEASKPKAVPAQAPAPAAAPAAPAVPAAPATPSTAPSRAELEEVKKEMRLLVWAAKTAEEKGMPQADMMRGKRDAKVQEYERMVQQLEMA